MNVGIDIVEIKRLQEKLERTPNLINKIFTEYEINKANTLKNKYQFLAGRMAAKEAFKKTVENIFNFNEIEIKNNDNGKPFYYIKNQIYDNIKLSISHEINYAVAIAINLDKEEIN